jgi:hypothetical protein
MELEIMLSAISPIQETNMACFLSQAESGFEKQET